VSAFRVLAGRIDPWRTGRVGFAHGGELGAGVVEVAEGFAAEGGGAAAVVVGEEVVAGGGDHWMVGGSSPGCVWVAEG
jgi:hypothetical protein